jgi:hypothetical protein
MEREHNKSACTSGKVNMGNEAPGVGYLDSDVTFIEPHWSAIGTV